MGNFRVIFVVIGEPSKGHGSKPQESYPTLSGNKPKDTPEKKPGSSPGYSAKGNKPNGKPTIGNGVKSEGGKFKPKGENQKGDMSKKPKPKPPSKPPAGYPDSKG